MKLKLTLVIIYEWTPTFAIGHLPSKEPSTEGERELTDSQTQKNMDTHPGIIFIVFLRRRNPWILRAVIHVRSETEKNSAIDDAASPRWQIFWNHTH